MTQASNPTPILDEAAVRHVAHLARLKISDAEVALYARQLSKVLEYVRQLNEVNTSETAPMAHPLPVANVLRDDQPREPWASAMALANAPESKDAFFKVPKVLDG